VDRGEQQNGDGYSAAFASSHSASICSSVS
jgi:hypothetical protein